MSTTLGELNIKVILEILSAENNAKKFTAELKNVSIESDKVKSSTVSLSDKIQGAGLRVDGFRAILDVLKSTFGNLISEYNRQEVALSKLSNGLKNVGEGADALNKLSNQSSNLQQITPFADEEITNAQAMLTTFQKNSEEIEILTPRILDLAAAYQKSGESGMDLQQVAVLLGKVNEETIGGLRRVGVAFTKEQEEKLKSLKGTEQAIYLSEILDSNFKGMAETVGNTAAGQMKIFDNKLSDVRESLGKILSDALKPLLKPLGDLLKTIADADEPTKILTISIIGLSGAFVILNTSMGGIPYIIGGIITVLANVYTKFKETGSIARATEADFSSFGSTIMTVMTYALTPIYQIKLAILAVKRAIDDTIYRYNALKTGEYLNAIMPGINELPDPNELSDSQLAKMQAKSFREVKQTEEKKATDTPPVTGKSTKSGSTNIEKFKTELQLLQEEYDNVKDAFEEPLKIEALQSAIEDLRKFIEYSKGLRGINTNPAVVEQGRESIKPYDIPEESFVERTERLSRERDKKDKMSEKNQQGLEASISLAQQLSNVLGIGADTFAGKLLSGLQEGLSLANSFASFLSAVFNIGSGGIFGLLGLASGGLVPGSGTGDTVPAMLTPGEFVVKQSRVSQLGTGFLTWLNGGGLFNSMAGHYASGGMVTASGSGGVQVVVLDSRIKGSDIVLSQARTNKIDKRRTI